MRRLVLGAGAFGALFVLTTFAEGDTPKTVSEAPPASAPAFDYRSLPVGHMRSMPSPAERPATIAAGAKALGMFVVRRDQSTDYSTIFVVGSESTAKALKSGMGGFGFGSSEGGCVTTSQISPVGVDAQGAPWHGSARSVDQVIWRSPHNFMHGMTAAQEKEMLQASPRVNAAHLERLERSADGKSATLAWSDAWVDPVTGGAKPIGGGSLPLTRVATGPSGLEVYAGRDEGVVHFIVKTGDVDEEDSFRRSMSRQMQAVMPESMGGEMTDCGFMRVTLPAGAKSSEMATFETLAILPPLHARSETTEGDDSPTARRAARLVALRDTRRRQLLTNVSSTQTSVDPDPVVSVSFGWGGKDEGQ